MADLRVGIYRRQSKDEGETYEAQLEACQAHAQRMGWTVVDVYSEPDTSGYQRRTKHPELERLIRDFEADKLDAILFKRWDRLTRQPRLLHRLLDDVRRGKVAIELISVDMPIDTTTPQGRYSANNMVALAEMESGITGSRIRDRLDRNAASGKPHGPRPFGLTVDRSALVEDEARVVREAAQALVAGVSLSKVALMFDRPRQSVRAIMTNRVLVGDRVSHGRVTVEGCYPAILTRNQFELVQASLRSPTRFTGRGADPSYLAGVVRCGECGHKMVASSPVSRNVQTRKYVCRPRPGCGKVVINRDPLDELVADVVDAMTPGSWLDPDVGRLDQRIEKVGEEMRLLVRLATSMPEDVFRERMAELQDDLNGLSQQRSARTQPASTDKRAHLRSLVSAVYVAKVGKGRKVRPGERVLLVRAGDQVPELPLTWPFPDPDVEEP